MYTFQDYYEQIIQPQIAAIDIFLKSEEPPYDIDTAGELLGIGQQEWHLLLQEEGITFLTRSLFFQLMKRGSSPICGMVRRAAELYLPDAYGAAEIAYIFDLPLGAVQKAMKGLGQRYVTDEKLPRIFSKISLAETRFLF